MFLLLDEYYKSNHSCFLLQYHLVLVTKYHHPRLTDGVKNILLQYARSYFEQCDCIIQEVILASVKSCRFLRLRGVRSCADSARGTRSPGPLFSPAGGTGTAAVAAAPCPPRQNDGGAGGYLRQNFSTVSIATLETAYVSNYFHTSHDSMTDMRPM